MINHVEIVSTNSLLLVTDSYWQNCDVFDIVVMLNKVQFRHQTTDTKVHWLSLYQSDLDRMDKMSRNWPLHSQEQLTMCNIALYIVWVIVMGYTATHKYIVYLKVQLPVLYLAWKTMIDHVEIVLINPLLFVTDAYWRQCDVFNIVR